MKYPVWLKNALYIIRCSKPDRGKDAICTTLDGSISTVVAQNKLADVMAALDMTHTGITNWLDETHVKSNYTAQRIVNHLFRCMSGIADFSLIEHHPFKPLYIRLKGLAQ
jgi:NAD(P)H-dependent FMN reductase